MRRQRDILEHRASARRNEHGRRRAAISPRKQGLVRHLRSPHGQWGRRRQRHQHLLLDASFDIAIVRRRSILPSGFALYYDQDNTSLLRASAADQFATPIDLSELAGTNGTMRNPTASDDELVIYWATNRDVDAGAGPYDIWVATRNTATDKFTDVHPVLELNKTTSNEMPSFISADLCTLYFESNRPGGVGGYDIYVATRQP